MGAIFAQIGYSLLKAAVLAVAATAGLFVGKILRKNKDRNVTK